MEIIVAKNKVWLNYTKIRKLVDISYDALVQNLQSYYDMRGGRKRVRLRDGEYFLCKDYVQEFIDKFGLVALDEVLECDARWIPVYRLSGLYNMKMPDLVHLVQQLKDKNVENMRDKNGMPLLQFRKSAKGRNVVLCLFNSNEARGKLADELGIKINMFHDKVPYKMQYNWSPRTRFSDDEIDRTILELMKQNYDFGTESERADALLSALPKSVARKLLKDKQRD